MRFVRILLLVVVASAVAGAFTANAKALGFEDEPCPIGVAPDNPQLKVCHPDAQQGKPYSLQIQGKGGCTPDFVRYDIIGGTFPPGLKIEPSTALVSGTPTQAGVFRFWLQISDIPQSWCADSKQSQWEFQITVDPSLHISPSAASLTPGQVGVPYSQQFTASGGTPTWTYSGTLPAGLSLNSATGLLSGTPTATGNYTFAITATAGSASDTQHFTMAVVEPLKITSPATAAGEVGKPFKTTLAASGGSSPYKWAVASGSQLPDGLTLDAATGQITGTPTASGAADVHVTLTDASGLTQTLDLRVSVAAKLAVVRRALPTAHVGRAYHTRIFASGGVAPRTWAIAGGRLPAGLHLNSRTGFITGSPARAGTAHVWISVTDKLGATSRVRFTLVVR